MHRRAFESIRGEQVSRASGTERRTALSRATTGSPSATATGRHRPVGHSAEFSYLSDDRPCTRNSPYRLQPPCLKDTKRLILPLARTAKLPYISSRALRIRLLPLRHQGLALTSTSTSEV
jgi:hypothetical protein